MSNYSIALKKQGSHYDNFVKQVQRFNQSLKTNEDLKILLFYSKKLSKDELDTYFSKNKVNNVLNILIKTNIFHKKNIFLYNYLGSCLKLIRKNTKILIKEKYLTIHTYLNVVIFNFKHYYYCNVNLFKKYKKMINHYFFHNFYVIFAGNLDDKNALDIFNHLNFIWCYGMTLKSPVINKMSSCGYKQKKSYLKGYKKN